VLEAIWPYLGDIHQVTAPHWAGVFSTMAAVACGGLIGLERQRAQKPAGFRTLILICLGSAIFAQASILMSDIYSDRTRIAAQVVSGIGFLGAGAIIRERGLVIGVTTGAGVWATSAVGLVLGSGYVAAGFFFTFLIVCTLAAESLIDRILMGPCRYETIQLTYEPARGRTRLSIQHVLDEHQHRGSIDFQEPPTGQGTASLRFCSAHREHRRILSALLKLEQIKEYRQG